MTTGLDQAAREAALDPTRSFIVQAPAGSGKTSLLTQRFLTLLAGVSMPEEILAITFTKKAAGEMRERIVHALQAARGTPRPAGEYQAKTWLLAQDALRRNDEEGWNLEENPARLRVVTIDSLCARLARGLPILSQFGASPRPIEDASEYYAEAARRTLEAVHDADSPHSESLALLLLHLDNNLVRVQEQIAVMLARRDKWMRPLFRLFGDLRSVGPEVLREALEETLHTIIGHHLSRLKESFGRELLFQLAGLARFAAGQLDEESPLAPWRDQHDLPAAEPSALPLWKGLGWLLLTKGGDWRRKLTKRQGFPRKHRHLKLQLERLLEELAGEEALRQLLAEVESLPPTHYSDSQWRILQALLDVSRLAAGQLTLVFRELGLADFVEISHRAERALGSDEEPTDLAMALDARLQHLLVDEFQDTSLGQLRLLERLTAEWVPGEGRTVFLVGDPMQSIYRFRDAEVGLFLQVRRKGLGHLKPEPLLLRSNFRSEATLVEWFNRTFVQIFPAVEDPGAGAVPYSEAEAAREEGGPGVECWAVPPASTPLEQRLAEAETVLNILRDTWSEDPDSTVAVLVRSRSHLEELLPLLKSRGHRFQGVDLEPLGKRPGVRDLLSLTLALCRPGDRLAWLSVLRAPWCGLTTADLLNVARHAKGRPICASLADPACAAGLSEEGRQRLARVWPPLARALKNRYRLPLRRWVEATWLELGGPAGLASETALSDCRTFLSLLEEVGRSRSAVALELVAGRMEKLFARPDVEAGDRLQIMTVHKSKGLEFDTVILPGLGNTPRREEEPLVSWLEWNDPEGGPSRLLLAPVSERGQERDPVYKYVRSLERKKEENEAKRLLYVAATRAKRRLHLVARVEEDPAQDSGTLKTPRGGTFLEHLWPPLEGDFTRSFRRLAPQPPTVPPEAGLPLPLTVRRLSREWRPPELPNDLDIRKVEVLDDEEQPEEPSFDWAGETVRYVGVVVHRVLQQVGREGIDRWPPERLKNLTGYLTSRLATAGVPPDRLDQAVKDSLRALRETLSSKRGRWILDPSHREARSEYAVSGVWGGRLVRSVVDRTFVDRSGTRWVIDYKTGTHQGTDRDTFLAREVERYKPQLNRYARLLRRIDGRPVRMALYFPLLKAWREWPLEEFSQPKQLELQLDF